jgi:hypothetical protein
MGKGDKAPSVASRRTPVASRTFNDYVNIFGNGLSHHYRHAELAVRVCIGEQASAEYEWQCIDNSNTLDVWHHLTLPSPQGEGKLGYLFKPSSVFVVYSNSLLLEEKGQGRGERQADEVTVDKLCKQKHRE